VAALSLVSFLMPAVLPFSAGQAAENVRDFAIARVIRTSDQTNEAGRHLPPWDRVEIWGISFKTKPMIGDRVTVVVLAPGLPSLGLTIRNVAAQVACVDDDPPRWQIELDPVTRADFFAASPIDDDRAAETPFDAAVLYPAVPTASRVDRRDIDPASIPDGLNRPNVSGAVDLTGDGRPEVLFLDFCTKVSERALDPSQCDYHSSRTYVRSTGQWDRFDEAQPC